MAEAAKRQRVLIAGLGNELLSDDGVGVYALRELRADPPAGATLAEIGTRALQALELFEEADVVIALDAVLADGPAGAIHRFDGAETESGERGTGLHGLGLMGAVRMLREEQRPRVVVLGVEPESLAYGMELTPRVRDALPALIAEIRQVAEAAANGESVAAE